jgi:CheY-like chemotaxis protein
MSGTLLYVEDNPDNLKLMELIVSHVEGLSMISTHTGELGIELARAEEPDVIILDINLPGMNGIEVLKKLGDYKNTRDIPVLALSAAATERDINKGLEAGFLRYLTKPIKVAEIVGAIRDVLES